MFFFGKKKKEKNQDHKNNSETALKDEQKHDSDLVDSKSDEEIIDTDKKKTRLDKLIMGAIVGVAVGSVIGASMAPKKKKKENTLKEIPTEEDK